MFTLKSFYRSNEWETFRKDIIAERGARDGYIKDDITSADIKKEGAYIDLAIAVGIIKASCLRVFLMDSSCWLIILMIDVFY